MNGQPMSDAEREMVCDELVGLVTEYLEGTISDTDRQRFETHIRECVWCENYVEQSRAVVAALGELGQEPPDRKALDRALVAFRNAHGGPA